MRITLLFTLPLITLLAAAADSTPVRGVDLQQQKGAGASRSGACGAAMVRIAGMETEPSGAQHFIGPQGVISIASATSSLTIGPGSEGNAGIFLQDRNALHCISTPKGPKLVLAMYCDGRACAPVDYRVIDPNATRVISKQDSSEECDVACAQRALGTKVPKTLQEEN